MKPKQLVLSGRHKSPKSIQHAAVLHLMAEKKRVKTYADWCVSLNDSNERFGVTTQDLKETKGGWGLLESHQDSLKNVLEVANLHHVLTKSEFLSNRKL
jgi:hypothetical protein